MTRKLKAILMLAVIPLFAITMFSPVLKPGAVLFSTDDAIGVLASKRRHYKAAMRLVTVEEWARYTLGEKVTAVVATIIVPAIAGVFFIGLIAFPVVALYRDLAGIEPLYKPEEHMNEGPLRWWEIPASFGGVILALWVFGTIAEKLLE